MSGESFELVAGFQPEGDQPQAIEQLVEGVSSGRRQQVLLGVTGSGKTFTMANVIARVNRPSLVIAPNKTLAAQLYHEFKLRNGFDEKEILSKQRSLKGVLEPFSTQGNLDLLARAGFKDIMTLIKYVCFEGFLAIK